MPEDRGICQGRAPVGTRTCRDSPGLRDLIARMGHDSERAAMIYQHEAQGADKTITTAIDVGQGRRADRLVNALR